MVNFLIWVLPGGGGAVTATAGGLAGGAAGRPGGVGTSGTGGLEGGAGRGGSATWNAHHIFSVGPSVPRKKQSQTSFKNKCCSGKRH